jgi:hypothetical protein
MGQKLHLYIKYHDGVMLRIDAVNLTKSVKRKWMSNRPEIKSHLIGLRVNDVCQISRSCDK